MQTRVTRLEPGGDGNSRLRGLDGHAAAARGEGDGGPDRARGEAAGVELAVVARPVLGAGREVAVLEAHVDGAAARGGRERVAALRVLGEPERHPAAAGGDGDLPLGGGR